MDNHAENIDMIRNALTNFYIATHEISDEDLKKSEECVARADSFGAIFDPTAYRTALHDGRLDRQRALLRLFGHVRGELFKIFPDTPRLHERTAAETEGQAAAK